MAKCVIIVAYLTLAFSIVTSQSTLKFDIFEEEQVPLTIVDLLQQSGLRDRHPPDVVAILTLEISPHERDHHTFFNVTSSGILIISSRLDRDVICAGEADCVIDLDIKIQPVQYFDIIKVELKVLDKNDNTPSFGNSNEFTLLLPEGSSIPQGLPMASDPDSPAYSIGSYELVEHNDEYFTLERFIRNDGTIEPLLQINIELDRETLSRYSFILRAIDKGVPAQTGSVTVIIDVTDTNDEYPVFDSQSYEQTIDEDLRPGGFVIAVRATDNDEGVNAKVEYSFAPQVEQSTKDAFDIDLTTGDITVKGILDYEIQPEYTITVIGRDMGQSSLSSQTRVLVHLNDVNDNAPIIEMENGNDVTVEENSQSESFVAYIRVSDPDSGDNGRFECQLDGGHFILRKIHDNDFTLVTNTELDRERQADYAVRLVCNDQGIPTMTSSSVIEITVTDTNDNPPVFDRILYIGTIRETNEIGELVMSVQASDGDVGDNARITYSIMASESYHANSFHIDPDNGDITISGPVDHEQEVQITLIVLATDHGTPSKNGSASVVLTVLDTDDERPTFIFADNTQREYTFAVSEHENPNMFVETVEATDPDSPPYNHIVYGIKSAPSAGAEPMDDAVPFRIDANTGDIYTTMEFDREMKSKYTFIVTASGDAPNNWTTDVTVTVYIDDINDHTPQFVFPNNVNNTAYVSATVKQGVLVSTVIATDADENDNALLHYSIEYDARGVMFAIDEFTGRITASRDFSTDEEVVVLTISVHDSGRIRLDDTSYLNVVFSTASSSKVTDDFNEELVIGIAVFAGIIVTTLTIAIVCLLRRHNRAKHNSSDYLKNCNEIMNAHNIINDDINTAPPPSNPVIMSKSNLSNVSLDSSYQSSVIEKSSIQSLGHENRGMVYDSDRGSFVVQPWKQPPNNPLNGQNSRQKTIPEEDSDSVCSLEGSNTDSGRGSNDDTMSRNITQQRNPAIAQRQAAVDAHRSASHRIGTRHYEPGVHRPANSQHLQNRPLDHRGPMQLYPDNKQYYDERVYRTGALNRSHDFPPAYHNPRAIHVSQRSHVPSPSPSLQYPPGHEQHPRNIQRQQSLNLPEVPPRKSVHYCSQV